MRHDSETMNVAAQWAVRTQDPDFDGWDAFTAWLEADPAYARAYDEVMAGVEDAREALRHMPEIANDDAPMPGAVADDPVFRAARRRRWWPLAGAAAAVAALMGVWALTGGDRTLSTAPGETRVVALDSGGEVALAGGTRIVLDRNAPAATLESGEAVFSLGDGGAAPFRVSAGGHVFTDIGTVFDVRQSGAVTRVAVAEGAVLYDPDGRRVAVRPGQRITLEGGAYRIEPIDPARIGEWRAGRLSFADDRLASVAADLFRLSGVPFRVAAGAGDARVSGSLLLDGVRADPQSIGPLLNVSVRRAGEGWVIDRR